MIVGLFGGAVTIPLPSLPIRAITLGGSYVESLKEMHELLDLAKKGAVTPLPIVTRPLASVSEVLEELRVGQIRGRAVLTP